MQLTPVHQALAKAQSQFENAYDTAICSNYGHSAMAFKAGNYHHAALNMLAEHVERLTDAFVRKHPEEKTNLGPGQIKTKVVEYFC